MAGPLVASRPAERGPDSRRLPIVLIHGMGSGADVWDGIVANLFNPDGVVAVSLAGHVGGADLSTDPSILDAMMADLERQLRELGIERAHMVGNSLGGWLALRLAERGWAESVLCLSPAGGWRPGGLFEQVLVGKFLAGQVVFRYAPRSVAWLLGRKWGRELLLGSMVAVPEDLDDATARSAVANIAGCKAVIPLCRKPCKRGFHELPVVDVPVTIAWSEQDRILHPRKARSRFAGVSPALVEIELPEFGHVPMLDDPLSIAAFIERTIDEVGERDEQDGIAL